MNCRKIFIPNNHIGSCGSDLQEAVVRGWKRQNRTERC